MGKRRGKERSQREDNPVDETGPSCSHIRKAIDHSFLKKSTFDDSLNSCQDCSHEQSTDPGLEQGVSSEKPAVWMCLKCGHRGCGRHSENQHAIKHHEKPRSDIHCLVLSLDNWSVWCYICDNDVHYSSTGQLAQLVTNITKQVSVDPSKRPPSRKEKEDDNAGDSMKEKPVEEKDLKQDGGLKGKTTVRSSSAISVKGLSNLGNTCFFNAVIQNLSQTQLLRQILGKMADEKTNLAIKPSATELEPIEVQLERPGSLTLAMCQLLNEIEGTKKGVVTPKELFTQVCKKAARFKGFQQQDSQELLRYLMDGMRTEEVKRVHTGILEALERSGKITDAEQSKTLTKEYEKYGAPKNFVDQVFGGEMTSTVMCQECKTVSSVTEVFLDLSLPVADEAYRKKSLKKVVPKSSVPEDAGRDSPTSLVNGDEDMPTGTGSKYQQKKAKKQAKKQAKNQRRQQKLGSKVTLEAFTAQDVTCTTEADESPCQAVEEEGSAGSEPQEPKDQLSTSDHVAQDQEELAKDSEREKEEEEEDAQEATANLNNRFTALSEDKNSEDMPVDEEVVEEEGSPVEGGTRGTSVLPASEEHLLADDLNSLSLDPELDDCISDMGNGEACAESNDKEYTVVLQDPELAFHTLATRVAPEKQESSVESCLHQFTDVENLTQNNSLQCVTCTKRQPASNSPDGSKKKVYRDALKQMLISSPPPVLTLHLKRFQQVGYSVCKVNKHVKFPLRLDLAPFCSVDCKGVRQDDNQVLYSLYGIVEHSGTMRSGHYTAFVKARPSTQIMSPDGSSTYDEELSNGCWFHISDSSVQPVSEAKVQCSQAYLLFYERIS